MELHTPETKQPVANTSGEIHTPAQHAIFDSLVSFMVGFDGGFLLSRVFLSKELSTNLAHGGVPATAAGLVIGAVSYIHRRGSRSS